VSITIKKNIKYNKNIDIFLKKKKEKRKKNKGVATGCRSSHPRPMEVAVRHPQRPATLLYFFFYI